MATYLVTGVAGFIASKVAEQLLEAGHKVVGIDNLNDYYDVRLKDYRLGRLLGGKPETGNLKPEGPGLGTDPKKSIYAGVGRIIPNPPGSGNQSGALGATRPTFEFHHLDIENLPALESVFSAHKFDAVFNLAARAGVRYSLEFPELYRRTNVLGEENVLKCQVKYGVKKHVLASSSSVYAGCPMPFVEDARLGRMQSPYAETKRQAELLALDYHQQHGVDVTALRYFTVFGPAGRPDMAPFRFMKWIDEGTPIALYGDGTQARDFTYVDDIARGTVLAGRLFGGQMKPETGRRLGADGEANRKPEGSDRSDSDSIVSMSSTQLSSLTSQPRGQVAPTYEVFNLGGGNNPLSISAMITVIERALCKKATIDGHPSSAADMPVTWADISKAERLLFWKPQVSPEQGIQLSVEWYVANRKWLKNIRL